MNCYKSHLILCVVYLTIFIACLPIISFALSDYSEHCDDKECRIRYARSIKKDIQDISNQIPNITRKEEKWIDEEYKKIEELKNNKKFFLPNLDFLYSLANIKYKTNNCFNNYINILNVIIEEDNELDEMFYWSGLLKNYRNDCELIHDFMSELLRLNIINYDHTNYKYKPLWYKYYKEHNEFLSSMAFSKLEKINENIIFPYFKNKIF